MGEPTDQILPFDAPAFPHPRIPTTPKKRTIPKTPPGIAAPVTVADVMLWVDGSRSPTLDTRKGRLALNKSAEGALTSRRKRRNSGVDKEAGNERPDSGGKRTKSRTRGARAGSEKRHEYNLRSKSKLAAIKVRKSDVGRVADVPAPRVHWKRMFKVQRAVGDFL